MKYVQTATLLDTLGRGQIAPVGIETDPPKRLRRVFYWISKMTTRHKAVTARGGRKLTPKQEAFCLAYVETGNASEAYRQAYNTKGMKPETVHKRSSELMADGEVTGRIESLKTAHAERHKLNVDDLLKELEEARTAALTAEIAQSSAAVSATMGKAKLLGLDKQILEHTGKDGGPVQVVTMTPDDIKRVMDNDDC